MSVNRKTTQLTPFWKIIILLLVNLAIFLVLVYGFEFYLSLTDPRLKLPPEPMEAGNQYGFREREFSVPKPPGVCRIMALGDSFTWGKGVWTEERYTNLLERYLREGYPDKYFEVLNFAIFTGTIRLKRLPLN